MRNASYTLKISLQGRLTLPRSLREQLHMRPGSRVTVDVTDDGTLQISNELPIAKYFGKLAGVWTTNSEDAADYARKLRNKMQPKL